MPNDFVLPRDVPSLEKLQALSRLYPEAEVSAIETGIMLLQAGNELREALESHHNHYGLSQARFLVLIALVRAPDNRLSPSDLADEIATTRTTMTGILDALERDNLIRRQDNTQDRRRSTIVLTAAGRRLLDQMLPSHYRGIAAMVEDLGERERKQLMNYLTRIRAKLKVLAAS